MVAINFDVEADDVLVEQISTVGHGAFADQFQTLAHFIQPVGSKKEIINTSAPDKTKFEKFSR